MDTLTSSVHRVSGDLRASVRIRNLVKRFRTKRGETLALNNVSLDIEASERVVLLGPSGCGKTTLLRCVAGLERPDEGEIEINGVTVFSAERGIFVPPERRGVSMMFQSYALWPHMTVAENIAYPLENRRNARKSDISDLVNKALAMVVCDGLQSRYPAQLSGGQQQRVALARAVIANEGIVLFDEPLSNVDAKVREQLRIELVSLQRQLGFGWLYVTHDQTEAMAVADRIAVFESGKLAQIAEPHEIYNRPASRYVATFMGASNSIQATAKEACDGRWLFDTEIGPFTLPQGSPCEPGRRATIVFRPEQLEIGPVSLSLSDANSFKGQLEATMFLGTCYEHVVRVAGKRLVARSTQHPDFLPQDDVQVSLRSEHANLFYDEV